MNTSPLSLRARRHLRTLAGLLALAPAALVFAQSSGTAEGDGGATQSGATGSSSAGGAKADAMAEGDARSEAMREDDAKRRAMREGDARSRALQDGEGRSRALGTDGRARPDDRMGQRSTTDDVTGNGTRAVTDLPPGVTSGGGSAVIGGTTRGATTTTGGGAALGDGMRMSDGSPNQDGQGRRDARTTARMIGEAEFPYRDRVMTLAEGELSDGTTLSSTLERSSVNVSGAARTQMNDAIKRMNAARTEFAKAISRARSANESRWEDSRDEVVDRYNDYVKAQEEALDAANKAGATVDEPGRLPAPPVAR